MIRLSARLTGRCVLAAAISVTLAACAAPAPPPPAPVPEPLPAKKSKPTVTPTPTPAPVTATPPASPVAPSDQFKVTTPRTPFYRYGPQQPGGPSQSLEQGTILTLLKRGFGYSQVRLRDQQTGYVATEDMAALTSQELMAQEQPEAPSPTDLGPLPRPGGVRRSTLPPSIQEELPAAAPSVDPEATPKGN